MQAFVTSYWVQSSLFCVDVVPLACAWYNKLCDRLRVDFVIASSCGWNQVSGWNANSASKLTLLSEGLATPH